MISANEWASQVAELTVAVNQKYWAKPDFWISVAFNVVGLGLTALTFWQAKKARDAAVDAGRTVKGQSVIIELSEIGQRIESIQSDISYREARDLFSGINRRVRRIISSYANDPFFSTSVAALRSALESAQVSLNAVKPTSPDSETRAPDAVFFGIEEEFATINNLIADLIGLMERQTVEGGNAH